MVFFAANKLCCQTNDVNQTAQTRLPVISGIALVVSIIGLGILLACSYFQGLSLYFLAAPGSTTLLAFIDTALFLCVRTKPTPPPFSSEKKIEATRQEIKQVPVAKPAPSTPFLDYETPVLITFEQTLSLRISTKTYESELPEYADSIFEIQCLEEDSIICRVRKGRSTVFDWRWAGPTGVDYGKLILEGSKVRSFCWELLAACEDRISEVLQARDIHSFAALRKSKVIVKDFLAFGARNKKAGYWDFLKLLNLLETLPLSNCLPLQRLKDLVHLQRQLPQTTVPRKSTKQRVREYVLGLSRAGLLTQDLMKNAEEAKKLGLQPFPAIPSSQRLVNKYPMHDAIHLLSSEYREAGHWLMTRTEVITFNELCRSIHASCTKITAINWDDFCIISVTDKSQQWMANIGYRFLPKLPKQVISAGHQDGNFFEFLITSPSRDFIVFDDGAYSGRLLGGYFNNIFHSIGWKPLEEKKRVSVILGFCPISLENDYNLEKYLAYNVEIQIIASMRTKRCSERMREERPC